ncbi:MAG TPA: T9SS type A sorting domain-containing protein [Bacteroidetes bacterium]|nr:T9SS type A sorting domain-containing protein [Bacteroidota bacterium]
MHPTAFSRTFVTDLTGNLIVTLVNEVLSHGKNIISWNTSGLNPGIYLIVLKQGNKTQSLKTIKIE